MSELWIPVLYALFLWWFSTGIILLADRLPRVGLRTGVVATSVAAIVALVALFLVRDMATAAGAFIGFTAGLVLWGWHEVSFLSGAVTGPRRGDCPPGATGWRRFIFATQTLIHHEIAIAVTVGVLAIAFVDAANPVGFWTFTILWVMRLSAKLNIFLGVPNVTEEFLPERLTYLKTYFRTRAINLLFPFSVTFGTGLTFWLGHGAFFNEAGAFAATAYALLATLTALAVIEHWFLVLPFKDAALWRWYLIDKRGDRLSTPAATADHVPAPPIGRGPIGAPTVLRRQS